MKALSIQQPWAWAIVNGYKPIENRDWRYPPSFRGQLLIHAGKKVDTESLGFVQRLLPKGIVLPETFDRGGIVGAVKMVDVVTQHDSPWFFGRLGFVFADAITIPFAPCRGQLGFFDVDAVIAEAGEK